MKRIVLSICLVLIVCSGQTAPQAKPELTPDQIQAFFKAVEEARIENWGHENWEQVQPIASARNIPDQMSLESWSRFVNAAAKSGLRSRMVLQVHPLLKQRPYFDEFVHILGYDSDLFTRLQVLGNMIKLYPDDPRSAKFGLLLLLDAWNGKWPDGIDLRGMSPRDALILAIEDQWVGAEFAFEGRGESTFGLAGATPERCAQLLSQPDKWVFDSRAKRWNVK